MNKTVKGPNWIGDTVRKVFDAKYVDLIGGTGAKENPFLIDVVDSRVIEDAIAYKEGKLYAHYGNDNLTLSKYIAKKLIKAGVKNFILTLKQHN